MWYSDDRNIIDGNLIFIPVYRKNICGNARKYKIIIWKAKDSLSTTIQNLSYF